MKIGACVSFKNIELAKTIGYDFVELSAVEMMTFSKNEWIQIKKQIKASGQPVIGFNSFCDSTYPIVGPYVDFKKLKEYFDEVLYRAYELNCRNIGIGAPKARVLPDEYPYRQALQQMYTFLEYAGTQAGYAGINILFEALHPQSCNFCNHSKEAYSTVELVNKDNVLMVWDLYHAMNAGESIKEVASVIQKVHHVHICSWDKYFNRYYPKKDNNMLLLQLFSILKELGYDSTISIEAKDKNFEVIGKTSLSLVKDML